MNPDYSYWKTEWRCVNCHVAMSKDVKMYSSGRCPGCGYKHPDAGTVVRCYEVPYRLKRTAPKWMFWIPSVREYGKPERLAAVKGGSDE